MDAIKTMSLSGELDYTSKGLRVTGTYNTNNNQELSRMSGAVYEGQVQLANYEVAKNGADFRYGYSEILDNSKTEAISEAVEATVMVVVADLAKKMGSND